MTFASTLLLYKTLSFQFFANACKAIASPYPKVFEHSDFIYELEFSTSASACKAMLADFSNNTYASHARENERRIS